jgi:hypothetical protein
MRAIVRWVVISLLLLALGFGTVACGNAQPSSGGGTPGPTPTAGYGY